MAAHVVPDTSVIIKWFRQGEVLALQALTLRQAYLEDWVQVTVPSLLAYELANVLRYKGDLSTTQVEEAVQSLFDLGLEWVTPSALLLRRAVAIARDCDLTVYDAAFVALAEALPADFVTADEQLTRRLAAYPFVRFLGDVGDEVNG
ncbi:MAG: type II toxin-antitoxin system VapC family toxin [Chloroflexi bacterium]|nr:type II toxin-antitoxin system VapC family toxin [Chloroflexota bacterium]MBU1748164.1 type II toxin-antitoxin system VapC family toxin [Chloroflexota bacterium]MBU1877979.1 type II toxin-antitoxin system VapC family toxin [Chloroflexota bacterium]